MTDRRARHLPLALTMVAAAGLALPAVAKTVLPDRAPVPITRSPSPSKGDPTAPDASLPIPQPRPESAEPEPSAFGPAMPPIEGQPLPEAEQSCRAALRRLGVAFEERPPESEPEGCVIAHPVAVTALAPEIRLEPEALLKCAMAETAARFVRQVVAPAAKAHFGSPLKAIRHASAYVCRPRNGSRKLSDHAFGNSLDLAGFELADRRVVEVGVKTDRAERKFLLAIRKAACGPFRTVLGPGSDADHWNHFHFDLAPRRPGSTFCR